MSCGPSNRTASRPVYTRASTSDAQYIALFEADSAEAGLAKLSFLLQSGSGMECRRAARYTNDGVTWTSPIAFGPDYSTSTSQWGTAYYAPITNYRRTEFGLLCRNASGQTGVRSDLASARLELRDDPFTSFGSVPSSWGNLERGLTRSAANDRVEYSGANNPYGDVFDAPSTPWSLAVVAATTGDPSGPGAWHSDDTPVWIGYNESSREWGVYRATTPGGTPTLITNTTLVGSPHAIARVSVASGGLATFEVSFDGFRWNTLYTESSTWPWRGYLVQDATAYVVQRELRG